MAGAPLSAMKGPDHMTGTSAMTLPSGVSSLRMATPPMSALRPSIPQPLMQQKHNALTLPPSSQQPVMGTAARSESHPDTSDSPEFQSHLSSELSKFWQTQLREMQNLPIGTEQDFKTHNDLPLARIKRIMKSDQDVRMISGKFLSCVCF